ncbi:ATP-grasp domain-containing protein [Psychroflexus halocasei]|uniref:Biotin carboxylase n=1 Tax=Psychroflexus halocasei TaxID=908615 RepID=A0A1H4D9F1_9FLAO|nr:ATP-grasp domain-containing protein [Psychroflexus halocasei]SEA69100.1 Biotin carboxylase [Psychroflexus halocasei]
MSKKLAIIGASYLQLPLVLKAKELGVETHCFAWEQGAVCKDYCDYFYPISVIEKEAILEECKRIGIDGITTIASDLPMPTIAYVSERLNLVSNPYEVSLNATNKGLMRNCFKNAGVPIPKFMNVNTKDETLSKELNYPVIVKPKDRSGSRGVTRVNHKTALEAAIKVALESSLVKEAIVEEFIEGQEVSVETISWKGKHYLLTITDKITSGAPNFVELEHHEPSNQNEKIQEKIREITIDSLNALGIKNGAGHTEVKIDCDGNVFVIEVGARMGGDFIGSHLVELSTGYDYVKGVIDVALNNLISPKLTKKQYAGVYFLCKQTEALMPYFNQKNDFEVAKELQDEDLKTALSSNDRSGYLIYRADKKIKLI